MVLKFTSILKLLYGGSMSCNSETDVSQILENLTKIYTWVSKKQVIQHISSNILKISLYSYLEHNFHIYLQYTYHISQNHK